MDSKINFTDLSWMDDKKEDSEAVKQAKSETLYGSCVLTINIRWKAEFDKWKKYVEPNRKWDFVVPFPANMQATYEFHTAYDVHVIAQKIVQLLQMGFIVHSARWQLKEYKSQLDQSL